MPGYLGPDACPPPPLLGQPHPVVPVAPRPLDAQLRPHAPGHHPAQPGEEVRPKMSQSLVGRQHQVTIISGESTPGRADITVFIYPTINGSVCHFVTVKSQGVTY